MLTEPSSMAQAAVHPWEQGCHLSTKTGIAKCSGQIDPNEPAEPAIITDTPQVDNSLDRKKPRRNSILGNAYRSYLGAVSSALLNLVPFPWRAKAPNCVLLGKQYDLSNADEHELFLLDFRSHILFTYRHSFPPLKPGDLSGTVSQGFRATASNSIRSALSITGGAQYKQPKQITSDAGWGCVIRAFQMALAQAFVVLTYGRWWLRPNFDMHVKRAHTHGNGEQWQRCHHINANSRYPAGLLQILCLFVDGPKGRLSLHNIVSAGEILTGKAAGNWYGPTSCAEAVVALINGTIARPEGQPSIIFRSPLRIAGRRIEAVWCDDGRVIRDEIKEAFYSARARTGSAFSLYGDLKRSSATQSDPGVCKGESGLVLPQLDMNEQYDAEDVNENQSENLSEICRQPLAVILFISLRLGVQYFNQAYQPFIQSCFGIPQFVGLAGGGPLTSAYYFIAANQDYLFYLDPHSHCLPAFESCAAVSCPETTGDSLVVELNGERVEIQEIESQFFAHAPKQLSWVALNPSMTLVFLCQDLNDFMDLVERIKRIDTEGVIRTSSPARENFDSENLDQVIANTEEGYLLVDCLASKL